MGELATIFPTWIERDELFHFVNQCKNLTKFNQYWDGINVTKHRTAKITLAHGDNIRKRTLTINDYEENVEYKHFKDDDSESLSLTPIIIILWTVMTVELIRKNQRKEKLQVAVGHTNLLDVPIGRVPYQRKVSAENLASW